jgi:ethanolamine utilization protein EutN
VAHPAVRRGEPLRGRDAGHRGGAAGGRGSEAAAGADAGLVGGGWEADVGLRTPMVLGRVIGQVVSTQKHGALHGGTLLLVQPISAEGDPRGVPILAVDAVGAGTGERVLVVLEGRAAGDALRKRAAPVDAAIVAIVDAVEVSQ